MTARRSAPGPRGPEQVRALWRLRGDTLGLFLDARERFGDVVRLRIVDRTVHLVSAPDLVHDVLVTRHRHFLKGRGLAKAKTLIGEGLLTSEGEHWRRQRRLAQPAFHHGRIEGFAATMTACGQRMLDRWETAARRGEVLDVAEEMTGLTLDIVTRTLFGTALTTAETAEVTEAMPILLRDAIRRVRAPLDLADRLPLPSRRRAERLGARLDHLVYGIIERRRSSGDARDDLLGLLMAARDADTGEAMDDRQVRDEVMTLFLAGHETTANALTWTWHLLAAHPEILARLQAEVDGVLAGRVPTAADVPSLVFTRMVLDESMRLRPPVWAFGRAAITDEVLGGYHVPGGSQVLISPYVLHRHPAHWERPEVFDPQRFAGGPPVPRFVFLPFGGGPRQCIGNTFALMEATLLVAQISARFVLSAVTGAPVVPEPSVTLRPRDGLPMRVTARL